jgi:hypothetical protein
MDHKTVIPLKTSAHTTSILLAAFRDPPHTYGPVPFWWWVGEKLDKDRISWQLDQLRSKGVWNAIVSYSHQNDGTTSVSDPPIFSDAWWELFRWTVGECKSRGMQLSFQDYTIINPLLQDIGRATVEMQGGQLRHCSLRATGGQQCVLQVDAGCTVVSGAAIRIEATGAAFGKVVELSNYLHQGILKWTPPEGSWLVTVVFVAPVEFDPMHPNAGTMLIDRLYAPFDQHCPGELGRTISLFFQDELDFGAKMPLWSCRLLQEFQLRKGYDLKPLLMALWHDIGTVTPKVRIDYADVVTTLMEECYFIPVFRWHQAHGTMLANDNLGRGAMEQGRLHYGDYFRTMRWYSAPGTDDPNLNESRAFAGLKVNSSIAHLYDRDRVWVECFHSSGWGATPSQVVAAINQDFVYGATVINLHGLYYSTHGSWWEWASPDFHFRQPYWEYSDCLNTYISRLCHILSQGSHVCDVAIVYPITSIEGGLNSRVQPTGQFGYSYSEQQRGVCSDGMDASEAHAMGAGKYLIDRGIDFDFVDFQSLENAVLDGERMRIGQEAYRVLVLPMMSSIRFSTLVKAYNFYMAGGLVIATGCLPCASDRAGAEDPSLTTLVRDLFGKSECDGTATCNVGDSGGRGIFIPDDYTRVKEMIDQYIVRDFVPHEEPIQTVHRRVGRQDIYLVFNPQDKPIQADASFRSRGRVQRWDAMTGNVHDILPRVITDDISRVPLNLGAKEAQLIVFSPPDNAEERNIHSAPRVAVDEKIVELGGQWEFSLVPTMDNRFGDFRLPIEPTLNHPFIGAEARRFRYSEETSSNPPWYDPSFNDSDWPITTYSFGPRFWKLGPIPPGTDLSDMDQRLAAYSVVSPNVPVVVNGKEYFWSPYAISLRWGIENDPFLKTWASGPHGLKMQVPDEFIDFNDPQPGTVWYLFSSVPSPAQRTCTFQIGSRSPYAAWLNGREILRQATGVPPGFHPPWDLPYYDSEPRHGQVTLQQGDNPLLMRFTQPTGQRVRAYAAFNPPARTDKLAMRWFTDLSVPHFNYRPQDEIHAGWYRFLSPPGLAALTAVVRGTAKIWVDGVEHSASTTEKPVVSDASLHEYHVEIPQPSPESAVVAIRVQQTADSYAGDSLPEPVMMRCTNGRISLGDWSQFGLATFSGIGKYRRTFRLTAQQAVQSVVLDLGNLSAAAAVYVNGKSAGTLIFPPWKLNLTGLVRAGENIIEVAVANTLANHYSVGIPTPYVLPGQTVSGLLGPVRLIFFGGLSGPAKTDASITESGAP